MSAPVLWGKQWEGKRVELDENIVIDEFGAKIENFDNPYFRWTVTQREKHTMWVQSSIDLWATWEPR